VLTEKNSVENDYTCPPTPVHGIRAFMTMACYSKTSIQYAQSVTEIMHLKLIKHNCTAITRRI